MTYIRKTYPVYRLWWVNKKGRQRYFTKRKNSFLYKLDRLHTQKTLKRMWFTVEYLHGVKNESVKYPADDWKRMKKDARIFTAASEVAFTKRYWTKGV